jgi:cytochrome c oxidase subunit IV
VSTTTDTDSRGHFGPDAGDGGAGDDDGRHMGHLDPGHTHGPTNSQYFTIFFVLLGITALEVSTYFWRSWFNADTTAVANTTLLILMSIKFMVIAGYFMHLKFDTKLLRRIFIFGLLLAMVVYTVALSSMHIWTHSGNPWFNDPPPEITTTTVAPAGP